MVIQLIVQFVLELLLDVNEHYAAVLVLYGSESVSLEVDNEGAALQVSQLALQACILLGQFFVLGLQVASRTCLTGWTGLRRKILRLYRSCDGRFR